MYSITVEYSDLDRVIRNLEQAPATLAAGLNAMAEEVGGELASKCEELSPVGTKWRAHDPRRTGPHFKDLWDYEVTPLGVDVTEVAIKNVHPAAGVILLGRDTPWSIKAKSPSKPMSFPWEALGWKWTTAQQVMHPAYEGHETHIKALDVLQDDIESKLSLVADRVGYIITRP